MTLYPAAEWRGPTPNHSSGVTRPPRGVVLHTADGTYEGTIGWQHNPQAQVSSYLVTAKDGRIAQVVDFDDKAWTQSAGNGDWIGVENEGHGETGEALTAPQLEAVAQFYAWAVRTWGLPLKLAESPGDTGLGWHGMGGQPWGGHFGCPGEAIKAQRPQIIARAQQILGGQPAPGGDDVANIDNISGPAAVAIKNAVESAQQPLVAAIQTMQRAITDALAKLPQK